MVSYQDSAVNIETRYTVEFVNNKKDWDYICKGIFNHGEPWDRYQSRKYSSLDDAITFYLMLGCLKKFCWMAKSFGKHILIHLH